MKKNAIFGLLAVLLLLVSCAKVATNRFVGEYDVQCVKESFKAIFDENDNLVGDTFAIEEFERTFVVTKSTLDPEVLCVLSLPDDKSIGCYQLSEAVGGGTYRYSEPNATQRWNNRATFSKKYITVKQDGYRSLKMTCKGPKVD